MRTVPPDNLQGRGIADLIAYFGWKKIAIIYSTEDYGSSSTFFLLTSLIKVVAQIVINEAAAQNITLLTVATFYEGSTDLSSQMQNIKSADARIIVVCCTNSDMVAVMQNAYNNGLIGGNVKLLQTCKRS
jgi:ABC-type branched-subunit amino acid transport system substrate-binding protein